jgi:hypothetical protein
MRVEKSARACSYSSAAWAAWAFSSFDESSITR